MLRNGKIDEGLRLARKLPPSPRRNQLLVRALLSRGRASDLSQASKLLISWADSDSRNPEPLRILLELYLHRDERSQLMDIMKKFRERAPGQAKTHYYEGVVRQLNGDLERAIESYRRAVAVDSASALREEDLQLEAAIEVQETAAGQYPGSRLRDYSQLLDCELEISILVSALRQWQLSRPDDGHRPEPAQISRYSNAWYNLGCALMTDFGRVEECIDCFRQAVDINPEHDLARFNGLFVLNYSTSLTPAEIAARHLETGRLMAGRGNGQQRTFPNERDPDRLLRVAYLSSDFRDHSVAHFILPVLESHDRAGFRIHVYSNYPGTDAYTHRARNLASEFLNVSGMTDAELMSRIEQDRIDILVDLNGLTKGHRLAMLARRAAPLQLTWLGYPNTTGLATMDYRIVDSVTDPPGQPEELHSENLIHMPGVFSVYQAPQDLPSVEPAAFRVNGFVTFGSFNHLPKINHAVLDAWAAILTALPDSRILVKSIMLRYRNPSRRLLQALVDRGVQEDRIDLVGPSADKSTHLEHYNRVDICLDTHPYSGTTTTCDSLVMGVPVITRAGEDHRSRVSASFLESLELEFLIAKNENDYIRLAVDLARDHDRLDPLRNGMRDRMLASPLMNSAAFTVELEAAYRKIWSKWCTERQ